MHKPKTRPVDITDYWISLTHNSILSNKNIREFQLNLIRPQNKGGTEKFLETMIRLLKALIRDSQNIPWQY